MTLLESLQIGGRFTFPKSNLVKHQQQLAGKRDLRKKLVKSNRPTYSRPYITKRQWGGLLEHTPTVSEPTDEIDYTLPDKYSFAEYNVATEQVKNVATEQVKEPEIDFELQKAQRQPMTANRQKFEEAYDRVETRNPSAAKYRKLLTKIAEKESSFRQTVKNPNAPAYGWFQMMQGGSYNNIQKYAGVSIEEYLANPDLQIEAAIKLADEFASRFTEADIRNAEAQGYNLNALIGGAWLGGPGGVKRVLSGSGNPSDKGWSPTGAGSTVLDYMNTFNAI